MRKNHTLAGTVPATLEVGTVLNETTQQGMVVLTLNGQTTRMDLDKTREVITMLQRALEVAVSDALVFQYLTLKLGLSADGAQTAMLDFRELRQGSKSIVFPQ